MSWTEHPIHVIDFEGHADYGIVEYGIATLRQGQVCETHTRLCQATGDISARETHLHRIRRVDTADAEPFAEERERFFALRQSGPLAAHHASTEDRLLRLVWPAPPFSPDFARGAGEVASWGPWLDTRVLYQSLYPGLSSYQLQQLVSTFQLQDELDTLAVTHCPPKRRRYHCALYDALAAALLLLRLCREPGWATVALESLMTRALPQRQVNPQEELF